MQSQLEELGYEGPTPRVKTTGTLVDKLRRERPMRLSQVQDVAGARVIVAGRFEQDDAVSAIREHFESQGCECKDSDRIANPSHGYRAFHLIVTIDQVNVEIQVRTELQDTWAQIIEELADTWGRGIRYGSEPLNPDARITAGDFSGTRREALLLLLKGLSDVIARLEDGRAALRTLSGLLEHGRTTVEQLAGIAPENLQIAGEIAAFIDGLAGLPQASVIGPLELPDGWRLATGEQAVGILRRTLEWIQQMHDQSAEANRSGEQVLRDTLHRIARATEQE